MNNCLWTNLMVILLYHNLERILFGAVDCGHQQESNTRNIWKSVCTNCVAICLLNWYEKTLIIWEKSQFAAWEITKMCAQYRYTNAGSCFWAAFEAECSWRGRYVPGLLQAWEVIHHSHYLNSLGFKKHSTIFLQFHFSLCSSKNGNIGFLDALALDFHLSSPKPYTETLSGPFP